MNRSENNFTKLKFYNSRAHIYCNYFRGLWSRKIHNLGGQNF